MLIASELRKPGNSLRVMEERARRDGKKISRQQINAYARGEVSRRPGPDVVAALAAALGCPYPQVAAAVNQAFSIDEGAVPRRRRDAHVREWQRLTEERSDTEVEELLLIVEQVLRMRDLDSPDGGAQGSSDPP